MTGSFKNMEIGGAIKSVTRGDDDWWQFDHVVSGKSRVKVKPFQNLGILYSITLVR